VTDLSPRAYRLGLGAVLLFAAVAGLVRLATPPIWLDEASSWYNVSGTWSHLWQRALQGEDSGGLLYSVLLKPWITLAGTGEAALRLPGVVLWLSTIAVLARAVRLTWSRQAALLAAVAALAHPSLLAAARQARSYILLMFLTALALLALAEGRRGLRRRGARLLAAASLGAAATHVMGIFVAIGAACAHLVVQRREPGAAPRAAATAAPALAFAAVWTLLIRDRVEQNLVSFWVPGTLASNYLAIGALLVAPLALACAWILWRDCSPRARPLAATLTAFALPIALGPAIVSMLAAEGTHLVQLRYASALAPLGAAAAGCALATLPRRLSTGLAALALLVAIPYNAGKQVYEPVARGGQDIRGAAAFLVSRTRPGDVVLIEPANDWMPLAYYGLWTAPVEGREGGWRVVTDTGNRKPDDAEERPAIWLVRFSQGTSAPPELLARANDVRRFGTLTVLQIAPR
jgi:mannosyltransferase